MRRGDIYYVNLGNDGIGCEQVGNRPAIIVQNNVGNKYSTTVIVALITSRIHKAKLPTHVEISTKDSGLNYDSVIMCEQLKTIDKARLIHRCGCAPKEILEQVDKAIGISIGLITQWDISEQQTYSIA